MIAIGGTIAVSGLVGSPDNVPVRGIHVHAWIGDKRDYNPNPGNSSQGQNGTGPGGVSADAYTNYLGQYSIVIDDPNAIAVGEWVHIVAIAESNTIQPVVYQVVMPPTLDMTYHSDSSFQYYSQFDDQITSVLTLGGTPYFADSNHNDVLIAPPTDAKGNLPETRNTALAFAAFSIVETYYDFATTVEHAKLASMINIAIPLLPNDTNAPDGVLGYASGTNWICLKNDVLTVPDMIGHELGHLVAASGGFFSNVTSSTENQHYSETNQRTMPPTPSINGNLRSDDPGVAWNEGFADYYATAADAAFVTSLTYLNIPHLLPPLNKHGVAHHLRQRRDGTRRCDPFGYRGPRHVHRPHPQHDRPFGYDWAQYRGQRGLRRELASLGDLHRYGHHRRNA